MKQRVPQVCTQMCIDIGYGGTENQSNILISQQEYNQCLFFLLNVLRLTKNIHKVESYLRSESQKMV